jgi:hypothetical protein
MSMPADPSRRQPPAWRTQGAGAKADRKASAEPAWRKDKSAAAPKRRLSRRTQLGIAAGLFVVAVAGVAALIWMIIPPPPACLVVVGAGYEDNLSLPHNVYGWQGARDLATWSEQTAGGGSWLARLTHSGYIRLQHGPARLAKEEDWAPERWMNCREKTLIILVALHGGADKAEGAYLFLDDPEGRKHFKLADLIASLAPVTKTKNVVLILDATQVPAHWPAGMLHNDFARELDALEPSIKKQGRLVVLSASMPDQRSWVSEEWRRSMFTHYLLQGLRGEAAEDSGGTAITVGGLYSYLKKKVERWAQDNRAAQQTPVLLPQGGGVAMGLVLRTVDRAAPQATSPEEPPGDNSAGAEALLAQVWGAHEKLRQTSPSPAVYTPHLWRLYEATLLRYEQLVRAGDQEHAQKLKDKLDELAGKPKEPPGGAGDQANAEKPKGTPEEPGGKPEEPPGLIEKEARLELSCGLRALPWRDLLGKGAGGGEGLLERLRRAKPAEQKDIWRAEKEKAGSVDAVTALRLKLARQLLDEVDRQGAEPQDVMRAHDLLLVLDDGGNDRPVEAHLLALLGRDLQERRDAGQKPTPADALRLGLATCRLAEETALSAAPLTFKEEDKEEDKKKAAAPVPAYSEFVYPWIAATVRDADDARRRGENLLLATDEDSWKESRKEFEAARTAYRAAQEQAEGVRKALAVYHEARAWLPSYAHYVADRAQSTRKDLADVESLAGEVDDLAKRLETPDGKGQSLEEFAEKAQANLRELQKKFNRHCEGLPAKAATQSLLHELDEVLTVPSMEPRRRLALLRQRRSISDQLNQDTGSGTPPALLATDPLADARRQGRMALAVLGGRWVRECNDKNPDALTHLQDGVNGDWDGLAAAGATLRECRQRLVQAVQDATTRAPGDQDPKAAEQDVRLAERLARQLDGAAAYLLYDVGKGPSSPVAELRHLLLQDLLREQAGRALADHWWGEKAQTPYYVVSGESYVHDARDLTLPQHPALGTERARLLEAVDKQLVPAGLEVHAADERLVVTDEARVDPSFALKSTGAAPQAARGKRVCWTDMSGAVVKPGTERQVLEAGQETVRYPLAWPKGSPPAKECKVTLHLRYRGQEVDAAVEVVPTGKPDLTVYQHPAPPKARIMVEADSDLYDQLAWKQMRIAIVFDRSYSMQVDDNGRPIHKLEDAEDALRDVLKKLPPGPKVSLWTFGHRPFYGSEDSAEQLRPLKGWTGDQADRLIKQVDDVTSRPSDAGSPIVHTMMRACEKDLDLHKQDRFGENPGAKLLLVLTDGEDNIFDRDKDYNPSGKRDIPTFLRERFDNSDVRVIVIGFEIETAKEKGNAKKQFGVVKGFRRKPGDFILAEDKAELIAALKKALKDQSLRTRIQARGADEPLQVSGDPGGDLLVQRSGQTLIPSRVLKPGTYTVSVPVVPPQEVLLHDGDQLLLKVKQTGLERALLREYDERRRPTLAQGLPGGKDQGWLVTVHGNRRPDDPGALDLLLSTETEAGRSTPGGVLAQQRPAFVWFEAEPREGKGRPEALSWRNVGDVAGYPAPAWRLHADGWPKGALPRVRAWVCGEDPAQAPRLATARTHNPGANPETFLPDSLEVANNEVRDLSVSFETREVEDAPGHKVPMPCLVVRGTYPPKAPVVARVAGGLKVDGQEHRFYSAANRYTGIFWGVTREQTQEALFELTLISVKAVREEPGTAKVPWFNLEEADRDLTELPAIGWSD